MLEGWYCRSIANEQAAAEEEERAQEESKFKKEYKTLKRKFQNLIYENEAFQQALRAAQKRLLAVTRDRTFLLDRLLMHEKIENSTSESDVTDSSDEGESQTKYEPAVKKKRSEGSSHGSNNVQHVNSGKGANATSAAAKKKRPPPVRQPKTSSQQMHHQQLQALVK